MRHTLYLYLSCLVLLLGSCKLGRPLATTQAETALTRMQALNLSVSTVQQQYYASLPSASGLELYQDSLFVVGDDSPYLYVLDTNYQERHRYTITDTASFRNGRMPAATKLDLESGARFTFGRDEMLLLLGSGSTDARNRAFLVNLSEGMAVQELDMTQFYGFLRQVLQQEGGSALNIEGLAMDEAYVYLLQRALGGGNNLLFRMERNDFVNFLLLQGSIPAVAVYHFQLPELQQYQAGFSGAYTINGKLFFTASVESAPHATVDGEVLGSYVGLIHLSALPYALDRNRPLQVPAAPLRDKQDTIYKGKAEALIVHELAQGQYKVVVVSDDDLGHSDLLELRLTVE